MQVNFITPTVLSPLDINSMGDSTKRGIDNKIGKYDSGLKYAIAILMRNNVDIHIKTKYNHIENDYTFGLQSVSCDITSKSKTLISIKNILNADGDISESDTLTSFSVQLGHDWENWMALREIWSNMIDENGYVTYGDNIDLSNVKEWSYTVITLKFDDDNIFNKIFNEKDRYILSSQPLFTLEDGTEIHHNPNGHLSLFKQGILIYEDKNKISKFIYNTPYGDIDERRILKNDYGHLYKIGKTIISTNNEEFLRTIITNNPSNIDKDDVLNNCDFWDNIKPLIYDIAVDVYTKYNEYYTFKCIIKLINEKKDSILPGRMIKSLDDHLFNYSKTVSINNIQNNIDEDEKLSILDTINKSFTSIYQYKCDFKIAELSNVEVIADKYNNCLLFNTTFDPQNKSHLIQFIIQYIDLTQPGNILENLAKEIYNLTIL